MVRLHLQCSNHIHIWSAHSRCMPSSLAPVVDVGWRTRSATGRVSRCGEPGRRLGRVWHQGCSPSRQGAWTGFVKALAVWWGAPRPAGCPGFHRRLQGRRRPGVRWRRPAAGPWPHRSASASLASSPAIAEQRRRAPGRSLVWIKTPAQQSRIGRLDITGLGEAGGSIESLPTQVH